MCFSEKLKYYRNLREMTQEEVAKKMNLSRQAISKWENGLTEPDIMSILQLCTILNITLDELLREDLYFVQKLAKKERSYKKLIIAVVCLSVVVLFFLCVFSFTATFS